MSSKDCSPSLGEERSDVMCKVSGRRFGWDGRDAMFDVVPIKVNQFCKTRRAMNGDEWEGRG